MIEEIIKEIKNIEMLSDERINQAREEKYDKLKKIKISCENEWEKVNKDLDSLKEKIIKKYETQAHKELKGIQEKAYKKISILQQLSQDMDLIIDSIIRNLL